MLISVKNVGSFEKDRLKRISVPPVMNMSETLRDFALRARCSWPVIDRVCSGKKDASV